MWDVVVGSGLAIAGTLAGSLVAGRQQTKARREERLEIRRRRQVEDVAALQAALADHRRAEIVREHARRDGAPEDELARLREISHGTRSAITAAQVRVKMTMPMLAETVDQAVAAVYGIGQTVRTDDYPELEAQRAQAREWSDEVTRQAGKLLNRH